MANICRIWLVLSIMSIIYAEYGLYMANVNNKYVQYMACIIWLMSIISICRIWLVLSANVNNKYMQYVAFIIWLMSIMNICSIWLVLSG